ncbi:glutamine--fructose-6-phosphate transaminase (isomerizing) [Methanofollis fontis]|uniref:Glutamine--fructose-6-phosphate aminotransferase [isomerizing] n=1 Tax=Methanofollis fontis TaxID=2052832 RepID=A0A483CS43_9EURY|nr:glutamine--fructose-6-phosphate transaminase (isomerizing) [Methanofollis fontis]TAJ45658.1 glutamine--fructose-6-phosphate transaminase (isomerizing) [Methanofollis fontis]
MCGIVGYIGWRDAAPLVVEGLKRLEYRGYDSFGVATENGEIRVVKRSGRISENGADITALGGTIGIGHTRWATHGVPNDTNAHPHTDCSGRIAVVHNGIIENYAVLKRKLIENGHRFASETDTEVIAHLVEEHHRGDLLAAVTEAVRHLEGSYAILVIAKDDTRIIAARKSSPLVLGIGDGETLCASDITPLLDHTERAVYLEDGDIAALTPARIDVYHDGVAVERAVNHITWSVDDAKKGGFEHYMLKEIYEQPQVFYNTIKALEKDSRLSMLRIPSEITVAACGTSYHASMAFRYLVQEYTTKRLSVELASEFKYYTPPVRDMVIGVTQSGETADTLAAIEAAKARNCPTLAVTNVLGSSITRSADWTVFMCAGPEISVAATKSFTAQLAVFMGMVNVMADGRFTEPLAHAHRSIERVLSTDLEAAVGLLGSATGMFYVGRGVFYPVALEGALKMKEISYIHAEGYAAGELKHGPFALLSTETPVVAICIPGQTYGVMLSNIKEMKARGAPIIGIGVEGDTEVESVVDVFVTVPEDHPMVQAVTVSVVLQLLAYHTANALCRDIDKPRNLAKSVTVE